MKKILWISVFAGLMIACQKSEIADFYTDDAAVYFQNETSTSVGDGSLIYAPVHYYIDSSIISLAGQKGTVKSIRISVPLVTMGKLRDYRRPVKVIFDEEGSTAVRGVDFEVDLDTVSIPANAAKGNLYIKLLRTDALLTTKKRVAFRLEENEYFKLHIQQLKASTNWASSAKPLNALSYAIIFHEQYKEPRYWTSWGVGFFGPWTPKKYQLVNELMGWTDNDWDYAGSPQSKVKLGRFDFVAQAMLRYLQELADADTPVIEADGSYMQLAPKYAVDYSKYKNKE